MLIIIVGALSIGSSFAKSFNQEVTEVTEDQSSINDELLDAAVSAQSGDSEAAGKQLFAAIRHQEKSIVAQRKLVAKGYILYGHDPMIVQMEEEVNVLEQGLKVLKTKFNID